MMNQTISQPVVLTEMFDENELSQELDDLLVTRLDSNLPSTPLQPQTTDNFGKCPTYSFISTFGFVRFYTYTCVLLTTSVR